MGASRNDREAILGSIRRSLASTGGALLELAGNAPPARPVLAVSSPALVELFCTELHTLNGRSYRCAGPAQAALAVETIMAGHEVREAIAWDDAELPEGVAAALRARGFSLLPAVVAGAADRRATLEALAQAGVCLSGCDAAIAQSGSIVVVSGHGRPRVASLLAPVHIAILPATLIVPALDDAIDLLRARFGPELTSRRSNFTIISGPSRTADIEQTLTLGAHGPKELHVVIVE